MALAPLVLPYHRVTPVPDAAAEVLLAADPGPHDCIVSVLVDPYGSILDADIQRHSGAYSQGHGADRLGEVFTSINLQGQKMYQIAGGTATETKKEPELDIPEEDVLLVAQQANVSVDRARAALEDTEGDLARAILMLSTG